MRKNKAFLVGILFILLPLPLRAENLNESVLEFGLFGKVHLYRQSSHPSHVALFVSGDGGWNLGVVDMARELAAMDALVAGIDVTHYLGELNRQKEGCLYPAADFESLSKYVQKQTGYPEYVQPLLVGYSSGATLVYAVLAQAPVNTFKGALSLGFCPDLALVQPPCKGGGLEWKFNARKTGIDLLPVRRLESPWVAFQGEIDQVCNAGITRDFVRQVGNADIVMLPKVGHGFSVTRNWLPQFREVFRRLTGDGKPAPITDSKMDLPVIEVPARPPERSQMAVIVSGDGGWAGLDRQVAGALSDRGIRVAGLDSLKYFWTARTPEGAAQDLARMLDHYLKLWRKESVVLIGYSLGADVLPFMAARLPDELKGKIVLLAMLAPGRRTAFEFHITDWIGGSRSEELIPVLPEVNKLGAIPLMCFYGEEESDSLCRDRLPPNVDVVPMAGAHHLGGNYGEIAERILRALEALPAR